MSGKFRTRVRRPTEEIALGRVAREALRLGISQRDLILRNAKRHNRTPGETCYCLFCRRMRDRKRVAVVSSRLFRAAFGR